MKEVRLIIDDITTNDLAVVLYAMEQGLEMYGGCLVIGEVRDRETL